MDLNGEYGYLMTKAYNIFTMHLDPTSAPTGFGEAQRSIARNGIDLVAYAVDTYGPLYETLNIADQYNVGATVVWRPNGVGGQYGFNFDVPGENYTLPVAEAAHRHYEMMNQVTPPEMDTTRAWRLYFNEPDKNQLPYIAKVSKLIAQRHIADGTRAVFWGINAGEPETNQWDDPDVIDFLRYVTQHPTQLAISLHEYSFSTNIQQGYPWLVGRFQKLQDACVRNNIDWTRLTTIVGEFGHGRDNGTFPGVTQSMNDIGWAAQLYGAHNNIRLVSFWLVSNNQSWGTLGQLTVPMIPMIAEATVANKPYPPYNPGAVEPPPIEPPADCVPREDYRAVVDLVPQNTTRTEMNEVVTTIMPTKGTITHSHNDARKVAKLGNDRSLVRIWAANRQPYAVPAMEEWNVAYQLMEFGGSVPPPEPAKIDILPYLLGTDKFHAELQYTWNGGGTHPIQTQFASEKVWYYVKGHSGEYEMLYYDNNYIYRGIDTSEAPDKFYTQNTIVSGNIIYGAMWAKRKVGIGEVVAKTPWIEHYWQTSPPQLRHSAQANDTLVLREIIPTKVYPNGLILKDVIFMTWNGTTEGYYFARDKGLVGFKFNGGESYITQIHTNRPDLVRNVVPEWEGRTRYYIA